MSRDRVEWGEVTALVARAAAVQIDCALRDFPRIAPLLTRDAGSAKAQFRFYRLAASEQVAQSLDAAQCTVQAVLPLTCQRCLGEVGVEIEASAELAFIDDEAAVAIVPESHDPVITEAGRISLAALVEEELLLAMPIVPMHADPAQCRMQPAPEGGEGGDRSEADADAAAPTQTPFAGLRELMKN